jgi:hypothetical protein
MAGLNSAMHRDPAGQNERAPSTRVKRNSREKNSCLPYIARTKQYHSHKRRILIGHWKDKRCSVRFLFFCVLSNFKKC